MKILFVAPRMHTNQIGILKALKKNGHEVAFHSILQGELEDHAEVVPVVFNSTFISRVFSKVFDRKLANSPRLFPNPVNYFRVLRELAPDIIVVRDPSRLFSLVAAISARILRVKIVFYNQNPVFQARSILRTTLERMICRIFDAVFMSPVLGDKDLHTESCSYIKFVPFCVTASNQVTPLHSPVKIISIGKYNPRKCHKLLLQAVKEIRKSRPIELTIVGEVSSLEQEWHFNELELFVLQENLGDIVVLKKNMLYSELQSKLHDFDLFVLPAESEPASIAVLEALSVGLPVICSDSCGTRWYIDEGKTGIIFKSNSLESLINSISAIINDRVLHGQMKIFARESSVVGFSEVAFYKSFVEMTYSKWPGFWKF